MAEQTVTKSSKRAALQRKIVQQWRKDEKDYLAQMAKLLPLPENVRDKISKHSILRMSTAYVKARQLEGVMGGTNKALVEANQIAAILDGFLLTVHGSGMVLDVSAHVHTILGHHPHDVIGVDVKEFLHPDDHDHFSRFLNLQPSTSPHNSGISGPFTCDFTVRFKYRIANKVNKIKQTGFVNLQLCGVLKTTELPSGKQSVLTVACYPLCLAPCRELDLFDTCVFLRMDNNHRLTHLQEWGQKIIGPKYKEYFVDMGHCCYPDDLKQFENIQTYYVGKGSLVMTYYSLAKDGQLMEGVSRTSVIFGPKGERLYSVSVDYLVRRSKLSIKQWPIKGNMLVLFDTCWLPGDRSITWNSRLHEVADLHCTSSGCSSPEDIPDLSIASTTSLDILSDLEDTSSGSYASYSTNPVDLEHSLPLPSDNSNSLLNLPFPANTPDILCGQDFLDFLNNGIDHTHSQDLEHLCVNPAPQTETLYTTFPYQLSNKNNTNFQESLDQTIVGHLPQDYVTEKDAVDIFDLSFLDDFDAFQNPSSMFEMGPESVDEAASEQGVRQIHNNQPSTHSKCKTGMSDSPEYRLVSPESELSTIANILNGTIEFPASQEYHHMQLYNL